MKRSDRSVMQYQRGFGALEAMVVLIIATLAAAGAAQLWSRYLDRQNNLAVSGQMSLVADAASQYIKDNYAAVLATATPSVPAVITVAMLRNTGYLPVGFADQNAYGQDYSILALAPTANKLQTLIVTRDGEVIKDLYLIDIAKQIGAQGGYVASNDTSVANGSFGGWSTALALYGVSPGAGHLATALFFQDGALVNDYLYRSAVPGQPNLNKMNTAIDMGTNDLNNAGTVNSTTTRTTGETYTGGSFRTQGDGGWYSEKYGGGWYMSDPTWVRAYADKSIYTGGELRGGKVTSTGRVEAGEYLQLDGVVTAGTACSPNGLVGRNTIGATLACLSGVWAQIGITPGGGTAQLWKAVTGKSISCSATLVSQYQSYPTSFGAMVDANGQPFVRINVQGFSDTGWQPGSYVENRITSHWYPTLRLTLSGIEAFEYADHGYYAPPNSNPINPNLQMQGIVCMADWP